MARFSRLLSNAITEAYESPRAGKQERCEGEIGEVHHDELRDVKDRVVPTRMTSASSPSRSIPRKEQAAIRRSDQPKRTKTAVRNAKSNRSEAARLDPASRQSGLRYGHDAGMTR
jgi:hypothetical protein